MKQLQEYFVNEYLTCGQARYNCIFENCPVDFLEKAEELLRQSSGNVKACIIKLSNQDEKQIEKTLSLCKNDYERGLLARDFISSLVMKEILKDVESGEDKIKTLQNIISCILQGEYEKAKWKFEDAYKTSSNRELREKCLESIEDCKEFLC